MKNKIILLIEDNPDDEELTLLAFRKTNLPSRIVVATDGEQALELLFGGEDRMPTPSIILLDIALPKISGIELLRRIRTDERTKLLPVVVLTSSDDEEQLLECYSIGCNSYVRKPAAFSDFVEAARRICLYWFELNQTPANPMG